MVPEVIVGMARVATEAIEVTDVQTVGIEGIVAGAACTSEASTTPKAMARETAAGCIVVQSAVVARTGGNGSKIASTK